MKKIFTLLLMGLFFIGVQAAPVNEGMWLPILLKEHNYEKMKALGLKLTPQQIYDANQASMKDAIVWFGGFCTGEIISDKGLVLTNHHCGYDAIATLSTTSDNILDNGFFATSLEQERKVDGLFASILVRMEDVSDKILPQIKGLTEKERQAKIAQLSAAIQKEATEGTHYQAMVRPIFNENQYILFVMERFNDVRLVGTPTQSVGKFGGDTDNWMWPRHTGDFSMFRIYANSENKPAAYSDQNVPYKPKHSLPVSLKGVKEGDYAMVMGYPGRTNRYATSYELEIAVDLVNPVFVKLRDIRLKQMLQEMKKSDETRLKLSSEYANVANYWKYFIGQTEQIKKLKVIEEKAALEQKFGAWATDKAEYNNVLNNLKQAHNLYREVALWPTLMREGFFSSKRLNTAAAFTRLDSLLGVKGKEEKATQTLNQLGENIEFFYESFNEIADENIIAAILFEIYNTLPAQQHPPIFAEIIKKYKAESVQASFAKYAKEVATKSIFRNPESLKAWMAKPNKKQLINDPAYRLAKNVSQHYSDKYRNSITAYFDTKNVEMRTLLKGLLEMDAKMVQYPDANSTFRMTYGSVRSYSPKDAVKYHYLTTLDGVMEKYVPGDYEFDVPALLIDLYKKGDYGQYADENGKLPVGFITDNDITGGNSGSPVINGNGELIGLAFDGNWEAMSGDIVYDEKYKRCINVDIRYVLFIIDKYHGASNIINELKLVK